MKNRRNKLLLVIGAIIILFTLCSIAVNFNLIKSLVAFPKAFSWLFTNLIPNHKALLKIPNIAKKILETILVSIAATTTATIFAFLFALPGSKKTAPNTLSTIIIRFIASIFRNIPGVVWSMILLISFGQNILTGYFTLFFMSFGMLLRAFIETIDENNGNSTEALTAIGAKKSHIFFQAILPDSGPQMISWILFILETNIRNATLIGLLTGTGIGFLFDLYYKTMQYHSAGLIVIGIAITILSIESFSNTVRHKIIADVPNKKGQRISKRRTKIMIILFTLITIIAFLTFDYKNIAFNKAVKQTFHNLRIMFTQWNPRDFAFAQTANQILKTISLAVLTTLLGAFVAFWASFFASQNLIGKKISRIIKQIVAIIRAIPTILWVLIFAIAAGFGSEAAVIGMSFHTIGYLIKAYSEVFEEVDAGIIEALKATGASWWNIIFQAVVPYSSKALLAWSFLRFEINLKLAIAMGAAVGAGGIGFELFMASYMQFNLPKTGFITILILLLLIIVERISIKVRKLYTT